MNTLLTIIMSNDHQQVGVQLPLLSNRSCLQYMMTYVRNAGANALKMIDLSEHVEELVVGIESQNKILWMGIMV